LVEELSSSNTNITYHLESNTMSTNNIEAAEADMICCASCGVAEVDDIKLMKCADCDLVRYCSDKCQEEHRLKHKRACEKRAAELRDEILFQQPESSDLGDCPICLLPLSIDAKKSTLMACCSKIICDGCSYTNTLREMVQKLQQICPFCRHPVPTTKEESDANAMKRVEANDPVALREVGKRYYHEGDYSCAFEYYTKAAKMGDVGAHVLLSFLYHDGKGVEKDEKKELHHLEEAAIAGHPVARYNLACYEEGFKRFDGSSQQRGLCRGSSCTPSCR